MHSHLPEPPLAMEWGVESSRDELWAKISHLQTSHTSNRPSCTVLGCLLDGVRQYAVRLGGSPPLGHPPQSCVASGEMQSCQSQQHGIRASNFNILNGTNRLLFQAAHAAVSY